MTAPNVLADLEDHLVDMDCLDTLPGNPRRGDVDAVARSLRVFGQHKALVARRLDDGRGVILAGNHTYLAAQQLGWDQVAVVWTDDDELRGAARSLADNHTGELGGYDTPALASMMADVAGADAALLEATSWTTDDLAGFQRVTRPPADWDGTGRPGHLVERFGAPPFSVLDARQGYWARRRDAWDALGIESVRGRQGAGRAIDHSGNSVTAHVSTFDPVLAELAVRWFCPPGGAVLDPFAGGSVRGIVASYLDRDYVGVDLSADQVRANCQQAKQVCRDQSRQPTWLVGDARDVRAAGATGVYDLVFTCPPYYDLERYGDDPADVANALSWDDYLAGMDAALASSTAALADDRFSVWVLGDLRDGSGRLRRLPQLVVQLATEHGLALYNDAILLSPVGTLGVRAGRQFSAGRKLGRTHQYVMVLWKGDPQAVGDHVRWDTEYGEPGVVE